MFFLEAGKGELFFGAIWVNNAWIKGILYTTMIIYDVVEGVGLLRLRAYGYWMFVSMVALDVVCEPLWWVWGRHMVAGPGEAPPGLPMLLFRIALDFLLVCWCVWRYRLFHLKTSA
jgi:hypothetical protein